MTVTEPAPRRRTFADAPSVADLAEVPPLERALRLGEIARWLGTLPPAHAALRRLTLAQLRATLSATDIADEIGRSRGLIFKLVRPRTPRLATGGQS